MGISLRPRIRYAPHARLRFLILKDMPAHVKQSLRRQGIAGVKQRFTL